MPLSTAFLGRHLESRAPADCLCWFGVAQKTASALSEPGGHPQIRQVRHNFRGVASELL